MTRASDVAGSFQLFRQFVFDDYFFRPILKLRLGVEILGERRIHVVQILVETRVVGVGGGRRALLLTPQLLPLLRLSFESRSASDDARLQWRAQRRRDPQRVSRNF